TRLVTIDLLWAPLKLLLRNGVAAAKPVAPQGALPVPTPRGKCLPGWLMGDAPRPPAGHDVSPRQRKTCRSGREAAARCSLVHLHTDSRVTSCPAPSHVRKLHERCPTAFFAHAPEGGARGRLHHRGGDRPGRNGRGVSRPRRTVAASCR